MTASTVTKTLIVVRHSKAEPKTTTDRDRPLAPRGFEDARAAGRWLAGQAVQPAVALVSSAIRARQTWDAIAAALSTVETRALDRLYAADVDAVLEELRLLDESETSVAVVGHNPTMQELAWQLSDGQGPAHATLADGGFPTSALAVLEHAGPWTDLGPGSCAVTAYHVARG